MPLFTYVIALMKFENVVIYGDTAHSFRRQNTKMCYLLRCNTKMSLFAEMGNEKCHYLRMLLRRWSAKMSLFTEIQHILFGGKIHKCRYLLRWNTKMSFFAEM